MWGWKLVYKFLTQKSCLLYYKHSQKLNLELLASPKMSEMSFTCMPFLMKQWCNAFTCCSPRTMHVCKWYPSSVASCLLYHIPPCQVQGRPLWKWAAWWLQKVRITLSHHSWTLCPHQGIRKGSGKTVTSILLPETLPAATAFSWSYQPKYWPCLTLLIL